VPVGGHKDVRFGSGSSGGSSGEGDERRRVEEGVGIDEEKREDDMTSYLKCVAERGKNDLGKKRRRTVFKLG
jgi:hypothetical protein